MKRPKAKNVATLEQSERSSVANARSHCARTRQKPAPAVSVPWQLLLFLLLLASCDLVSGPKAVNRYTGTDGLLISFAKSAPPAEVYEDGPFPVKLELQNAGALNVSYEKMIITITTDPLYVDGDRIFDNPDAIKALDTE